MDTLNSITQNLKIPLHYVKQHRTNRHLVVCMVHEQWLQKLLSDLEVPSEFVKHDFLSAEECQHLLTQPTSVCRPWKLIFVYCIAKKKGVVARFPKVQSKDASHENLTYSQLLHYITETNFKNLWKEAYKRYSKGNAERKEDVHFKTQEFNDAVRESIRRTFRCPILRLDAQEKDHATIPGSVLDPHVNVLKAFCALESSSSFFILQPYLPYMLHDCITFSPAIFGSSYCKPLFVIYQLLQALRDMHDRGLFVGDVSLHDIGVDQNLWLQIYPRMWDSLENEMMNNEREMTSSTSAEDVRRDPSVDRKFYYSGGRTDTIVEIGVYLNRLVEDWVHGDITNFDYLMELNHLAGRRFGNPNHHPVLPWVIDFSSSSGGWRDLSKSKYRLTKGDKQLDMQYESLPAESNSFLDTLQVPHHILDFLTDITYYVYKSRRTPRTILCHHVRSTWVPGEYPSSIQRMQEWTPDECIPEFYTDPSIFISIHRDMADLEVPPWARGPDDFVVKHRAALESDHVSDRLHNWIDLTFGYRLSGNAAIKSKNVCLNLVDQHTTLSNSGVVQLFTQPHPHKLTLSAYHSKYPPKSHRHQLFKESQKRDKSVEDFVTKEADEDTSSTSELATKIFPRQRSFKSSKTSESKGGIENGYENQQVILPKDYNPLMMLNQLDLSSNFIAKTTFRMLESTDVYVHNAPHALHQRNMRDMITLGCLVVEIFLAHRLRYVCPQATLEERYTLICKILKTDFFELPRCVRHVTKLILQLDPACQHVGKDGGLPLRYPAVTEDGLPPPSAHQLLQPVIQLFSFPSYFQQLYLFLSSINEYKDTMAIVETLNISVEEKEKLMAKLSELLVKMTAKSLPQLLSVLAPEAVDIIVPYLQEMFDDPRTNVLAAWYLFDPIAQVLGPNETKKTLLGTLIHLYDSELCTGKSLKLFHRSYLLQLIVRLGLQTFLNHFVTRLVEAVGGFKDNFSERNSCLDKMHKTSHIHSPELEPKPRSMFNNLLSPYDEDACQADVHNKSDTEVAELDPDTELEVFPFEAAEDLNVEHTEMFYMDHDSKFVESSDSADGVSISDGGIERGRSPDPEEVHAIPLSTNTVVDSVPNSLPHSFSITINKEKSETLNAYSTSVPVGPNQSPNRGNLASTSPVDVANVRSSPNANDDGKPLADYNISDVAMESIIWLSYRLGPVLTAKFMSRNLLRMLGLCYYGKEQLAFVEGIESSTTVVPDNTVSVSQKVVVGDLYVPKVLNCLASIAALYGEQIILLQYLPHIHDLVASCKRKITPNYESGLVGSMMLLKHIIPYLSDTTLMDHLHESLIENILRPCIRLISSQHLTFPNKGQARQVIAFKLLDVVYLIGLRIGFEMTRKHLTHFLCRFFASFDKVHSPLRNHLDISSEVDYALCKSPEESYLNITKIGNSDEYGIGTPVKMSDIKSDSSQNVNATKEEELLQHMDIFDELKDVFTPEMAYIAYVPFCRLAGGIHMEQSLINDELIRNLCMQYDEQMNKKLMKMENVQSANDPTSTVKLSLDVDRDEDESVVSGSFGKNVAMVGNRIDIQLDDETVVASEMPVITSPIGDNMPKSTDFPKYDLAKLISKKMENSQRHLHGTWLAYWEHEIGRSEKDTKFNFKQIKLQTFSGHTNSIRAIHCLDNENSFISASKDKTVKLWSLRNHGDGSAHCTCQWTYMGHKKSVFAATFLESLRLTGSCDSSVHLWDPFMGSCIKQFDSTRNTPVTVLTAMPAPSSVLVAGTTEATIRFLDARMLKYLHEYKVSTGPAGLIRCITVSPNGHWLAIGHSSGVISILDVRTGLMTGSWKGHEGEILQIKAFNNNTFVTSSLDHCISVWNADDGKLQCHLRGPTEPVHCLNFYKNEMVSTTTANRIGVHTSVDNHASFSSTRLRSETFKGVVTSLTVLPLNRLLLLGADNGTIRLLC